jgi:hypothetical protein
MNYLNMQIHEMLLYSGNVFFYSEGIQFEFRDSYDSCGLLRSW